MSAVSYSKFWKRHLEENLDYYTRYEEMFSPWRNWERSSMLEMMASSQLEGGLNLLYAGDPIGRAREFLARCVAIVDRALEDHKFSQGRSEWAFPGNRGESLQIRAYAHALLGEPLRTAELRQAVEDRRAWFEQLTPGLWYEGYEEGILSTARVAMILGDWDLVSSVIPFKFKIKSFREEMELLLQMKNRLREKGSPLPVDLAERFTAYFEKVRDPIGHPKESYARMARFELGILYCQHVATSEPFSWEQVIHEIAK